MEKVVMVKKNKRKIIPGVVHKDFSARVQTVDQKTNSLFYDLIKNFNDITGVPVLLNTSFNLNGENQKIELVMMDREFDVQYHHLIRDIPATVIPIKVNS